jgi:hypothetical protein
MKIVLISSILGILLSVVDCGKKDQQQNVTNKIPIVSECFKNIDTTQQSINVGCISGFWQIIDSNLVIKIAPNISQMPYNKCFTIDIDSTNTEALTELFIFKEGEANLANICSDIIFTKKEPLRSFHAVSGQIIVELTEPTDYYGNIKPKVSIFINELIFINPKTKKKIELRHVLLWKILDFGTPG